MPSPNGVLTRRAARTHGALIVAVAAAALMVALGRAGIAILLVACTGAVASVDALRTARRVDAGLAALRAAADRASAGDLTAHTGITQDADLDAASTAFTAMVIAVAELVERMATVSG